MAIVTSSLIQTLRTGYSKAFQEALAKAPTQWASVATRVPSGNSSNTYGWLGQFPSCGNGRAIASLRASRSTATP